MVELSDFVCWNCCFGAGCCGYTLGACHCQQEKEQFISKATHNGINSYQQNLISTLCLQDNDYDVSFKKDQGEVSFEKPSV